MLTDTAEPVRTDELAGLFRRLLGFKTVILAVSGGPDSTALLHLAAEWAGQVSHNRPALRVATVDHGLRTASRDEAMSVAGQATGLRLQHHVLTWVGPKPIAGLQAAARDQRYRLLETLALEFPEPVLVTAHHLDDQAETVLMRLARGSGIDGLAGIRSFTPANAQAAGNGPLELGAGVPRVRPLLTIPKARLLATLNARDIAWIEDPSNADATFERSRWRAAQPMLEGLGLTTSAIARSAARIERARLALESQAEKAWRRIVELNDGTHATLCREHYFEQPEDIQLRLLMRGLVAFGDAVQYPALAQAEDLVAALGAPGFRARTLSGCCIAMLADRIVLRREPGRQGLPVIELHGLEERREPAAHRGQNALIWDNRFAIILPEGVSAPDFRGDAGWSIRSLGTIGTTVVRSALKSSDLGRLSLPAAIASTLPSLWKAGRLVAVPHLQYIADGDDQKWAEGFAVRFLW